jgi:hypothetical protein
MLPRVTLCYAHIAYLCILWMILTIRKDYVAEQPYSLDSVKEI